MGFARWNALVLQLPLALLSPGKDAGDITVENAPLLWKNSPDLSSRDLFYGPGGKQHQPHDSFIFEREDLKGTAAKLIVRDRDGVKWTVKMGSEAKPETAASRLIWAVGYLANEDYFLTNVKVANLPARLRRGQKLVEPGGSLRNVRLKRHLKQENKTGDWPWSRNNFSGTRELNGLRVMMALLNNWDLTDENNAIYSKATGAIYMVSDLGSTFGSGNLTWPMRNTRGNLEAYRSSKFITYVGPDYVDFHSPARTSLFFLATPHEYFSKLRLRWIGKHVPIEDVRWMGRLLAQLSPRQIRDAFRAAGYSPQEVEGFADALENRVAQLEDL